MGARGVPGVLPGAREIAGYERAWLRGDVLAGLTVAAYLVPQVMAYAGVAGLNPIVGLWAAVPSMLLYAVLGSCRQLSVGPESTTALMSAVVVAPLAAGDAARYVVLSAGLAVLVGLVCVVGWIVRVGFLSDLLSGPVLVGYMAGVAVIMIISQLGRTTGVEVGAGSLPAQVADFARGIGEVQWPTLLLALTTLGFLLLVQSRYPRLPGPLLAVLLASGAVAVLGLDRHGIAVVGALPGGLPGAVAPALGVDDVRHMLLPAVGVAVVGYSDTVLTARAFAARNGYAVDPNAELLALGAANLGAGLLQGFPVSSSASRTALGDSAGSRTQLFSLVGLVVVVLTLVLGGGLLATFPQAALGALIVYAALRLVDAAEFRRILAFRRSEALLAVAAFAGVLLVDILYGVLIAVGLSVADMLRRVARPHDAVLGRVAGLAGMHDVDDYPGAQTVPGLVVYRYDAPLFFADAEDFKRRALAAADSTTPLRWFVINAEAMVEVDITGLDAVESLRRELTGRGVVVGLARVKQELLADLRAYGLVDRIGEERIYPTLPTAVEGYEHWCTEHL